MQEAVLPKLRDSKISTFILWTPSYTTDSNADWVKKGAALFEGMNVRQYWDEGQKVAGTDGFGSMIKLPRDAPLAYDVYMVYGKGAEWKEKPPMPAGYLHQVFDDGKWFEPARFLEMIRKLG